ncbi:MAG: glutaredoxin family protein [Candidatus Eisenbacteria bacterium]|nr:glutaredoxin family protein [Candidatus Eisenbacteria bacterium]
MKSTHVPGTNRGKVFMFAISTCVWCRKTKRLLKALGVAHEFIDVDLLEGEEKARAVAELRRWNPRASYPTLVIDEKICIRGYDERRIREELES